MKESKVLFIVLFLVAGLAASIAMAANSTPDESIGVDITVSPKTFILSVDEGEWVTVHTDLPFSSVESASVLLNGIPLVFAKSDNQGYFVAKLNREDVEATVLPPRAVLEFTGRTYDGVEFYGTASIRVIE